MSIKLKPTDKVLRDQVNNVWRFLVPADTTPEDCLKLEWYASADLLPYDIIEATARDGRWWAEFLVYDVGFGWADLLLLKRVDLPKRKKQLSGMRLITHRQSEKLTFLLRPN